MATRSIASLSLTFGLVSIPVRPVLGDRVVIGDPLQADGARRARVRQALPYRCVADAGRSPGAGGRGGTGATGQGSRGV
jgi:hypothetical protein